MEDNDCLRSEPGFQERAQPLFRPLSDQALALWIEEHFPQVGQRVISAVQLNRPDADIQGMSPELIGAATRV